MNFFKRYLKLFFTYISELLNYYDSKISKISKITITNNKLNLFNNFFMFYLNKIFNFLLLIKKKILYLKLIIKFSIKYPFKLFFKYKIIFKNYAIYFLEKWLLIIFNYYLEKDFLNFKRILNEFFNKCKNFLNLYYKNNKKFKLNVSGYEYSLSYLQIINNYNKIYYYIIVQILYYMKNNFVYNCFLNFIKLSKSIFLDAILSYVYTVSKIKSSYAFFKNELIHIKQNIKIFSKININVEDLKILKENFFFFYINFKIIILNYRVIFKKEFIEISGNLVYNVLNFYKRRKAALLKFKKRVIFKIFYWGAIYNPRRINYNLPMYYRDRAILLMALRELKWTIFIEIYRFTIDRNREYYSKEQNVDLLWNYFTGFLIYIENHVLDLHYFYNEHTLLERLYFGKIKLASYRISFLSKYYNYIEVIPKLFVFKFLNIFLRVNPSQGLLVLFIYILFFFILCLFIFVFSIFFTAVFFALKSYFVTNSFIIYFCVNDLYYYFKCLIYSSRQDIVFFFVKPFYFKYYFKRINLWRWRSYWLHYYDQKRRKRFIHRSLKAIKWHRFRRGRKTLKLLKNFFRSFFKLIKSKIF